MSDPATPRANDNIALLINGGEGYGVRRAWLGMLAALRRRGREVSVESVTDGPLVVEIKRHGLAVNILGRTPPPAVGGSGLTKLVNLVRRLAFQLSLVPEIAASIKRTGAGSIMFSSPLEVLMVGLAARRSDIPAYWLMPNAVTDTYPLDINRRLYRFAFRHLNVVPVGNSQYTIGTLGDGAFRRHVVHLGVEQAEFAAAGAAPTVTRAALGIPDDAVVVGVFARMIEQKGQLRLLEAVAGLRQAASSVHLLFCGGPAESRYVERIRDAAREHGLQPRVHLLGPIEMPQPYYGLCDVVANSRIDPEPFGLSVIEAMMMGKPVLAHAAGGPSETVLDGETGWLLRSPDLAEFKTGLQRMLDDRARWSAMGGAGRARALEHFTADAMVSRLVEVIDGEAPAVRVPVQAGAA